MPNWCDNRLIVTGDPELTAQWLAAQRGVQARYTDDDDGPEPVHFTFNAQVPVPEDVLAMGFSGGPMRTLEVLMGPPDLAKGTLNGHDWQVQNWGTKWDVDPMYVDVQENPGFVELLLQTAWSPPTPWLKAVAPLWPGLHFELRYFEPGMAFAGELFMDGGAVSLETSREATAQDCIDWGYDSDEETA